jgi:hypothetical protein
VRPRVFNGHTDLTNLQLLHRHCHDQKSVLDGSGTRRRPAGVHANNRVTEEPNAAKAARSVFADESRPRGPGLVQHMDVGIGPPQAAGCWAGHVVAVRSRWAGQPWRIPTRRFAAPSRLPPVCAA